ncbi:hypothetical protein CAPTEDRAFT_204585 [Capitella teleta]|nr:hypothetical protein CAPTEDRAFT_204585 [Capitella teleta]|eukprot:ELU08461.1 hypothetical protein CAPTEDRAFT_204585 [Capitella teleta]
MEKSEDEEKKADDERDDQDVAVMEKSEDEEKKADDERDDQDVAVMEKSEDEEKKADDERDDQDVAVMKKSEDEEKNDDVTVDARNETLREVNGNEKEDACKKTMDEEDTEKEIERKEIKEKEDDGKQTVRKEMMEEDIVLSSEMSEEIEWKGITSLNFINNGLFDDDSDSQDGVNIGLASPEANSAPSEFSHCRFLCQTCGKICQNMAALKSHAKTHETKVKKYTKPKRLCPFCKKDQSRLTRHLRKMHSEEEEVQILIEGSSCEKKEIAEKLRKKGILEANKSQLPEENPKFIAERSTSTSSVVCSLCSGFYSRLNFYKHKNIKRAEKIPEKSKQNLEGV